MSDLNGVDRFDSKHLLGINASSTFSKNFIMIYMYIRPQEIQSLMRILRTNCL